MRGRPRFPLAALIALLLLPIATTAGEQTPVFSSLSELVVLHVSVKDGRGAFAADLPQDAFRVYEDGRPQTITFFASQDAPVTGGLLIDGSGSMQPIRDLVIASAVAFAEASNPKDELFALTFNEDVQAVLPSGAPYTSDIAVLREALSEHLSARGRTALFDALAAGLDYVAGGRHERKVLVVVSDGGDNASRATFKDVLTRAESSNAVVYTVALVDALDADANPKLLRQIADATGGDAYRPRDADQVSGVLKRIAHDIRNTYTVGYISTNAAHDGTFRRVRVEADSPGRGRLAVHARAGYLAAPPATKDERRER